eukprot:9252469-Ditylum_brightwellii.AAC.1
MRDWTLDNHCNNGHAMGDLTDLSLAAPNRDDYEQACRSGSSIAKQLCDEHRNSYERGSNTLMDNVELAGISVADLDNDGFLDLVVAHYSGHT